MGPFTNVSLGRVQAICTHFRKVWIPTRDYSTRCYMSASSRHAYNPSRVAAFLSVYGTREDLQDFLAVRGGDASRDVRYAKNSQEYHILTGVDVEQSSWDFFADYLLEQLDAYYTNDT